MALMPHCRRSRVRQLLGRSYSQRSHSFCKPQNAQSKRAGSDGVEQFCPLLNRRLMTVNQLNNEFSDAAGTQLSQPLD